MPSTVDRVPSQTAPAAKEAIREEMLDRIAYYSVHPERIAERLDELDREWDIERTLEANASSLAFTGLALGIFSDRRWLLLPVLVTGFLFQHAMQGWCPPLPALRRLGFRTADEINQERYALKALRGDFEQVDRARDKLAAIGRAVDFEHGGGQTLH